MSPARRRSWDSLSHSSQRRWIAAFGGRGSREQRNERASLAYEAGEHLTAAQRGHEPSEVRANRTMSGFFGDDAEYGEVRRPDRAEARRLGRYDNLVRQLRGGRITGAEFERTVRRMRLLDGRRFASNPQAVLARLEVRKALDLDVFTYVSGRAA